MQQSDIVLRPTEQGRDRAAPERMTHHGNEGVPPGICGGGVRLHARSPGGASAQQFIACGFPHKPSRSGPPIAIRLSWQPARSFKSMSLMSPGALARSSSAVRAGDLHRHLQLTGPTAATITVSIAAGRFGGLHHQRECGHSRGRQLRRSDALRSSPARAKVRPRGRGGHAHVLGRPGDTITLAAAAPPEPAAVPA